VSGGGCALLDHAPALSLSRISRADPHMSAFDLRCSGSWGCHDGSSLCRGDARGTERAPGSGPVVGSRRSRSGAGAFAVAGGMVELSDRRGVRRQAGQRAPLALDIWPQRGCGASCAQGARPRAGEGPGGAYGGRDDLIGRRVRAGEMDLAASAEGDRRANRRLDLEITARRGDAEKRAFAGGDRGTR
jgi:hypothetical protein